VGGTRNASTTVSSALTCYMQESLQPEFARFGIEISGIVWHDL
jgi:hypothetical protein